MDFCLRLFLVFYLLLFGLLGKPAAGLRSCDFPAIYNFGDSNSDTGAISAAIGEVPWPNGVAFFGQAAGRHSDGRLIVDFITENLTLPYLNPYLDSVGANFRHGANFATGGSCIRPTGGCSSPFHLGTQVVQFSQFKARTIALRNQPNGRIPICKSTLARLKDFSKALYTFDIGQNDLAIGFQTMEEEQLKATIPEIIGNFTNAIQLLYKEGARFFWVQNTGPVGCLPYILRLFAGSSRDRYGCVEPLNNVAVEFNRQLKNRISELKKQHPFAVLSYVDMYSAKFTLISNAKALGFVDPFEFCCVTAIGRGIGCGKTLLANGTELYSVPCKNPTQYISWDGIHYSQTANMWVANRIISGSLSDPPVPIRDACRYLRNS